MEKTVVIIDDSKFLIDKLQDFLEKEFGFKVVGIGFDGNMAIELYRKYKPDLITLDITMPNKDGHQAMKEILADFPRANILIVSAISSGGNRMLECMSHGAKGYIEKPLRLNDPEFVKDFKTTVSEIFTSGNP